MGEVDDDASGRGPSDQPCAEGDQANTTSPFATAAVVGAASFVSLFTFAAAKPVLTGAVALLVLLVEACVGALVFLWFRQPGRTRTFRDHARALNSQAIWAGAHIALLLTQLRGAGFVFASLFLVTGLVLFGLGALTGGREGAAGLKIMLAVAALVFGFFKADVHRHWFPALARAQIAIAPGHFDNLDTADLVYEDVAVWVFYRGPILDGGTGIARDPSQRMADPEFADDIWYQATADPTECIHVVDDFYWCW